MAPREVARATGVSTDTLRHYERKGLLPRAPRTHAGYRRYPPDTVERVLLIQRALVIGFTLSDLKRVFAIRDRGGAPCRNVRAMVAAQLEQLDRRVEELLALRGELRALLVQWDATLARTPAGQPAHLLQSIGSAGAIERARNSAAPQRAARFRRR